jgi:hypothetical protein
MVHVSLLTALLLLWTSVIARQLPIYFEDSHAGSFEFFAQHLELDEVHTLVLFDAHSDASSIADSDSIRQAIRRVRSNEDRASVLQKYRTTGVIQPFNWIEPLMPNPFTRVIWVPGDGFSQKRLKGLELEARIHLDWKSELNPRTAGELGPKFEVVNFSDLKLMDLAGKTAVSIDLDIYAQENVPEDAFYDYWAWVLSVPQLKAISFAISRPWLESDSQGCRLLQLALDRSLAIQNSELIFEPFKNDEIDRSEKAKGFYQRGENVPRFDLSTVPTSLREVLVRNSDRISVSYETERWQALIDKWKGQLTGASLNIPEHQKSIDGAWRMSTENLGDVWLKSKHPPKSVKWYVLRPESMVHNLVPELKFGKIFTGGASSFVSLRKEWIATTEEPALGHRVWGKQLPWKESAGIVRLQAEAIYEDHSEITAMLEIRVRYGTGFRGALSEQFGSPYVFGIGKLQSNGEKAGETLIGNDCANFLVYAWRQVGGRLKWGNPYQLTRQLTLLSTNCSSASRVHIEPAIIDSGVAIDFGSHITALWQDRGEMGVIDPQDLIIHHLSGEPEVVTLEQMLKKYSRYKVFTLPVETDSLTVRVGGDVNLTGHEIKIFSAAMRNKLQSADYSVINLECVLADSVDGGASKPFSFIAPTSRLSLLEVAGVDAVNLANNHAYDGGIGGHDSTLDTLAKSKIESVGSQGESHDGTQLVEIRGRKFGLLSFNAVLSRDDPPDTRILQYPRDENAIESSISKLRKSCDIVIILPHWGSEYTRVVTDGQRSVARWLVRSGADVVVGSHPHIRQAIEYYRGVPIVYSLGNLYFPNRGPAGFNDYQLLDIQISTTSRQVKVNWSVSE